MQPTTQNSTIMLSLSVFFAGLIATVAIAVSANMFTTTYIKEQAIQGCFEIAREIANTHGGKDDNTWSAEKITLNTQVFDDCMEQKK